MTVAEEQSGVEENAEFWSNTELRVNPSPAMFGGFPLPSDLLLPQWRKEDSHLARLGELQGCAKNWRYFIRNETLSHLPHLQRKPPDIQVLILAGRSGPFSSKVVSPDRALTTSAAG